MNKTRGFYFTKYNECTQDEPCDGPDQYVIVLTDSGRYKTAFHVARVYYGPIIGAKGQNRKRLEDETKTIIRVPRHPQDQDIVITGSSRGAVAAARRRIEMTVMSYRSKQQATHFISIPMINPEVKARLNEFKDIVLKDYRTRGVDESIFQNPEKLHLTLCTMVLNDNFERSEAVRVMESCKRDVIDPLLQGNSITILLSGIEYMNDDPNEVDVLYARVHANEILQRLVDDIVDYFFNAGLIDKQFERVKLHVTIMNTLFRDSRKESNGKYKARETFNVAPMLEAFRDFQFGEVTIDTIHLSTRFTTSSTGYYQATTEISLYL
ncbi:activating signal cointegrator 1 complex subunit 1 isoform X2 [Homalodisca vitripennis]|uniref:activating signal cointegrator 1 complex subunit 1 isoform X2 n=1 Tax=Homalodisca vitripennis TaxID=197043 RepID=UPI001EEA02A6|nr:activating signal cointegrator 1 complex subunit 1 isoform X2 [Homalodisca vitripennis]